MKITVQRVIKGVRYLKHYGFKEFLIRLQEKMESENVSYEPWYERHRATGEQLRSQRKKAAGWKNAPVVSIVVPLYCTKEAFLREMIESVQAQSYDKWELCLADASPREPSGSLGLKFAKGQTSGNEQEEAESESSSRGRVERIVREYADADERITYCHLSENLGIAGNTNAAIELASGDWIAFLDHDDLLAPDALYEAVRLIRLGPKVLTSVEASGLLERNAEKPVYDMIYTDEDKVDTDGKTHFQPHFKPDINIDLLRSNNYITHFLLVSRALLDRVGGIRREYEGAQDYDFILRCVEQASAIGHVPRILYHWRTHQESTSDNPFSKQYAADAGRRAIESHLDRLGVAGEVIATKDMGFYRVKYRCVGEPLVSIVIPSKDEVESLQKCLSAIEKSGYQNYEVIVVENNSSQETFAYYQKIAPIKYNPVAGGESDPPSGVENSARFEGKLPGGQRVCVAVWEQEFNYSKLNNFGVFHARGEYLLLMNNDIEMIGEDWLTAMLSTCQRKEVGVVGAKLYYPDDTVQHAGIVVGIGGSARGIGQNMFVGMKRERSGYLHKASLTMDYSAVTAACLMVSRDVYGAVGGFEEKLAVAFNDVDFCLKVRAMGLLVVYQPAVEAYHYESKSRGSEDSAEKVARFQREIEYMRTHWIGVLKNGDPYYNPNFSAVRPDYSLGDNS